MKAMHITNAVAWLANTAVWSMYAGVPFMAIASGVVTVASLFMARAEE